MTAALDDREITGRARTHVLQSWQPRLAAQPAALDAFLDIDVLARVLREADMLGRELVLEMLPALWARHVLDTDPPP
ncbi:MAG: hypothetical protein EOO78_18030 [Oxalobacteraceae bacterium]|nr:MAG: hypothetical protein EOO78_18030 [Oxalobacteraceae bacterium]